MRRNGLCLSLLLISVLGHSQPARSQGIGEMGGAYGASTGQAHGLMNTGTTSALTGQMGNATKSISGSTSGAASAGSGASGGHIKNTTARDGDEPPTPAQTAKKAGDLSNKLYIDAQAKFKAGDFENADKLFRQSLYYRESIWGSKDPAVPKIYDILGDIARKRAAPIEAEKCYNKSLMTLIKQYGQGDYVLVTELNKLGALYLDTFKFADAVNSYSQVYQLTNRKLGEDNELTVQAALNLAKSYLGDEDFRLASNLLREYATRLDKGPDSNMQQLSSVLELYQTALQKTNQTEALQRTQTRAQEVTDLLAAQKMKDESKSDTASSGTSTESGAATAEKGSASADVKPATDAAKPASADASKPASGSPDSSKAAASDAKAAASDAKAAASNTKAAASDAAKPNSAEAAKTTPSSTSKATAPSKPAATKTVVDAATSSKSTKTAKSKGKTTVSKTSTSTTSKVATKKLADEDK
jgi:hypothetical protein